ncbi:MAG: peptidylprolyl isomerase [Clostridia bacterium]|nr:peptidylprolyl isomerase [Clostridia bacterium]
MSVMQKIKKGFSIALASLSTAVCVLSMSSCTTSKPEVELKISFNGTNYTLEYTLFRKIAPATVSHFLALADADYYDGLCVHDFSSSKWVTGGYSYANGKLVEKDYFAAVQGIELTNTVWYDAAKTEPTYTVYGEFKNNDFEVENGALNQSFGSLTMYYEDKLDGNDDLVDQKVTVLRNDGKGDAKKLYAYNSATSQFYISMSTNSSSPSGYCTFALLKEESTATLQSLQQAVLDYIAEVYGDEATAEEEFAPATEVYIHANDKYASEREVEYWVPQKPIVIEQVNVKKW